MATQTTITTPKGLHLDVLGFSPAEVIPNWIGLTASTRAGVVEGDEPAVRVPFLNFDDDATFVAEGTPITEADPDASEVVIATGKVAVLAKVSREQYEQDGAASLLSDSVRRSILRKANGAFVAQVAPTAPAMNPPAGLLNLGITDGGTIAADLDELVDAIATIENADGTATSIIASPAAWAALSKLKTGTGSAQSLLGAGTDAPIRQLLGLPVQVTKAVPTGQLLVLDQGAVLSAYGEVKLAVSDQAYFGSDSIGLRATFRFGQQVVDGDRVVKLSVTA